MQNRVVPGAAAPAARGAAHRRHHREGVARLHDGRAPGLARRALRHALPVELRPPAGEGRAGAHRRRRRRPGVRRRRVQHARLARSRIGWPRVQLTATDVVRAIREQNVQVAAGVLGAPPAPTDTTFQLSINAQGRLIIGRAVRRDRRPRHARRADHAGARRRPRSSWAPTATRCGACSTTSRPSPSASSQRPGTNALAGVVRGARDDGAAEGRLPRRRRLPHRLRPDASTCASRSAPSWRRCSKPSCWWSIVVMVFLQTWRASIIPLVAVPVSLVGTFAVMLDARLLAQHAVALRPGAGHRHRRRRCHRRGRERRAAHRARAAADGGDATRRWTRCRARSSPSRWCCARCSCPTAFISGLTGQFYRQFALTIAISTVISAFNSLTLSPALAVAAAAAARRAARPRAARHRPAVRLVLPRLQPLLHARPRPSTPAACRACCACRRWRWWSMSG